MVYIGKTKAEETLAKLPEPVQTQVREAHQKLADKKLTVPEILSPAMRILKDAQFYGNPLCDAVAAALTSDAKNELLGASDDLFNQDPLITLSIEKNLITFDIITKLDDRATQKWLRYVDQQVLAKALKGAEKEIQNKVFKNMSKRAASLLKEDMEFMGPVRVAVINEARDRIIKIILRLEENGDIVIANFEDLDAKEMEQFLSLLYWSKRCHFNKKNFYDRNNIEKDYVKAKITTDTDAFTLKITFTKVARDEKAESHYETEIPVFEEKSLF